MCASLLASFGTGVGWAHQIDEYVSVTHVEIQSDVVRVLLRLTPGMDIAPGVMAHIDANGDGWFSEDEQRRYSQRFLETTTVAVDSVMLTPQLAETSFPALNANSSRAGQALIRMTMQATMPPLEPGRHSVVVGNTNHDVTGLVANALPDFSYSAIRIGEQTRDRYQRQLEIAFVVAPRQRAGWLIGGGLAALMAAAGGLAVWRRGRRAAARRRTVAGGTASGPSGAKPTRARDSVVAGPSAWGFRHFFRRFQPASSGERTSRRATSYTQPLIEFTDLVRGPRNGVCFLVPMAVPTTWRALMSRVLVATIAGVTLGVGVGRAGAAAAGRSCAADAGGAAVDRHPPGPVGDLESGGYGRGRELGRACGRTFPKRSCCLSMRRVLGRNSSSGVNTAAGVPTARVRHRQSGASTHPPCGRWGRVSCRKRRLQHRLSRHVADGVERRGADAARRRPGWSPDPARRRASPTPLG